MKGQKTGGRQKGSLNRHTAEIDRIIDRLKCNPFEILCLFANGDWKALGYKKGDKPEDPEPVIEPGLRLRAAGEASKYIYPQKRELSTGEEPIKIIIEDYRARASKEEG